MQIPKELDKWIMWKVTAINPSLTHAWSEAQLMEDARYDLGRDMARGLRRTLKELIRQRQIIKVGDKYQLPRRKVYKWR